MSSLAFSESDRAKEGDGFDQVGTNPCNSKYYNTVNQQDLLFHPVLISVICYLK